MQQAAQESLDAPQETEETLVGTQDTDGKAWLERLPPDQVLSRPSSLPARALRLVIVFQRLNNAAASAQFAHQLKRGQQSRVKRREAYRRRRPVCHVMFLMTVALPLALQYNHSYITHEMCEFERDLARCEAIR